MQKVTKTFILIVEIKKLKASAFKDKFGLGPGESEALQLSTQEEYILATDDGRAIKAAKILGIKFVTAVHCLLYLHKNKKIDTEVALEKLKSLEKYGRYNSEIIKNATKIIQGDKNDE